MYHSLNYGCYLFMPKPVTYDVAVVNCKITGSILAEPKSLTINNLIAQYVKSFPGINKDKYWIGINDIRKEKE